MKIKSFSLSRYRSIVDARKIDVGAYTVLIGKNNEGKTNILSAINTAFVFLRDYKFISRDGAARLALRPSRRLPYEWTRDFPINIQAKPRTQKESSFRIVFELSDNECHELDSAIKFPAPKEITIEISIGSTNIPKFKIIRHGRKSAKIERATPLIIEYITNKLSVEYIPAVRTDRDALEIIGHIVSSQFSAVEKEPAYQDAVAKIAELQKPILQEISKEIKHTLSIFIPSIINIEVDTSSSRIYRAVTRDVEMIIDDGTPTSLAQKGDGIKSLVALSLSRHKKDDQGSSVLLIEEPEAHLHPGAAHDLKEIIQEISQRHQVILSTHNPVFVNRTDVKGNIIVQDGKASPSRDLKQLRDCLGVRVSDNLQHAELVILVEGDNDEKILKSILEKRSRSVATGIKNGNIVLEKLGGTSNLIHRVLMLKNSICKYYVIFDADSAGRSMIADATKKGELDTADYTLLTLPPRNETEIEDFIAVEVYKDAVEHEAGVQFSLVEGSGTKKWSDRMKEILAHNGKTISHADIGRLKGIVAGAVQTFQGDPVIAAGDALIQKITVDLEQRLSM